MGPWPGRKTARRMGAKTRRKATPDHTTPVIRRHRHLRRWRDSGLAISQITDSGFDMACPRVTVLATPKGRRGARPPGWTPRPIAGEPGGLLGPAPPRALVVRGKAAHFRA